MRSMICMALMIAPMAANAQQRVDTAFRPKVARPAYAARGPVVAIDGGHANFHTLDGQYAPFAALLSADGYSVRASAGTIDDAALAGVGVFLIANARSRRGGGGAFTEAEIETLYRWVAGGGSLLLIADHAPFGTAAAALAARFGVGMGAGYVVTVARGTRRVTSQIDYAGSALGDHPIIAGRNGDERVKRVRTFTGQSLGVPAGATALLTIPADALEVASPAQVDALRTGGAVSGRKAGGRAQALAMTVGKGRVVVTGEAGMFTAQILRSGGQDQRFGMSLSDTDDQQLALNTLHWLSHAIE